MQDETREERENREDIEAILRESVGQLDAVDEDENPQYPTMPVDVWIEFPLRPDVVHEQARRLKELLQGRRLIAEFLNHPEYAKNMAPATFITAMNGSWFYGFTLMAFGQLAGWWVIDKPKEFADPSQYADIDQWISRVGYVRMAAATPS